MKLYGNKAISKSEAEEQDKVRLFFIIVSILFIPSFALWVTLTFIL